MSDPIETLRTESADEGSLAPLTGKSTRSFHDSTHASVAASFSRRPSWAQIEGTPLPLGATWIEDEQAFNFAVYSEHADTVTLLLYSADDFVNPVLTFEFDFLRNKSGRIWHCRLLLNEMRGARYYAY